MVEGHEVNECSAWGIYAGGSKWMVGTHVELEMGVTGSYWDWRSACGWKAGSVSC